MRYIILMIVAVALWGCSYGSSKPSKKQPQETALNVKEKYVVYQVFTRLFGNKQTTNKPWGTLEENGVGKFSDFTPKALEEIKALGVTHIWYTGVPHHALVGDYTSVGISNDDPDVIKGRAGSPYAVKDYYNVNPDLADDPAKRLEEFEDLVSRTHKHGMKVLIDIVPNHVARKYESLTLPAGAMNFGDQDDTSVEYARDNNFYYIPGQAFQMPDLSQGKAVLGGASAPLADDFFDENPAKWTGNGSRDAKPGLHDWYETVKVNYGVKPDGSKDFEELPAEYSTMDYKAHYEFWKGKSVPRSWHMFRDIAYYWLDKGVDGFRYDMAELVPVEFWSYMNSSIKMKNPDAFLLAEVYNPDQYRNYIQLGKMDYLYDKVELYDTLKVIMQGHGSTDQIAPIQHRMADIEHHMLHFLENHDEQRIASPDFVGEAKIGKPSMVVSTLISTSPTMVYFGQEVGEPAAESAGFGDPTRTSIFDYVGVPHHQRWMNGGAFDGGQLSNEERNLRAFYKKLLNLSLQAPALRGEYFDIHAYNREHTEWYNDKVYSFVRWNNQQQLIVVSSFERNAPFRFDLQIPSELIGAWGLADGEYMLKDLLNDDKRLTLAVKSGVGYINLPIDPLDSWVLTLDR